eukprot:6287389-Pyramimonas_sp.AAC.1
MHIVAPVPGPAAKARARRAGSIALAIARFLTGHREQPHTRVTVSCTGDPGQGRLAEVAKASSGNRAIPPWHGIAEPPGAE